MVSRAFGEWTGATGGVEGPPATYTITISETDREEDVTEAVPGGRAGSGDVPRWERQATLSCRNNHRLCDVKRGEAQFPPRVIPKAVTAARRGLATTTKAIPRRTTPLWPHSDESSALVQNCERETRRGCSQFDRPSVPVLTALIGTCW